MNSTLLASKIDWLEFRFQNLSFSNSPAKNVPKSNSEKSKESVSLFLLWLFETHSRFETT